jgi:hypothetical protein
MGSVCPKSKEDNDGVLHSECNCMADRTCGRETNTFKDIKYGYKDRTITVFVEYCPKCGRIFSVYHW